MPNSRTLKTLPHPFNDEVLTRQRLVRVALGQEEADLVLTGATVLNAHTVSWKKNWAIAISGQRIAWTGPAEQWAGRARNVAPVAVTEVAVAREILRERRPQALHSRHRMLGPTLPSRRHVAPQGGTT